MGQFPEFLREAVQPIRTLPKSNINEYDKSTIVSIFPLEIEDYKYTIGPKQHFVIPPGTFKKPALLIVGQGSWWAQSANDSMPPVEVICSSVEIANSIVSDWCRGLAGVDPETASPGVFCIPGKEIDELGVLTKYSKQLERAKEKQNKWFEVLVRQADALWTRSNGNPLVIWDLMKLAARELNLNQKPWLADAFAIEKVKCYACGSMKDPTYPVCPVCRAVDSKHKLAGEIKFAG